MNTSIIDSVKSSIEFAEENAEKNIPFNNLSAEPGTKEEMYFAFMEIIFITSLADLSYWYEWLEYLESEYGGNDPPLYTMSPSQWDKKERTILAAQKKKPMVINKLRKKYRI